MFKRPDAPACLVLDVRMPGLSGLDLQRELAAANLEIPIIFITGHGERGSRVVLKCNCISQNSEERFLANSGGLTPVEVRRIDGRFLKEEPPICSRDPREIAAGAL
jgi:CheY-like chemotaxis protein